jgi:DNA invertase Pin-like site-specific DNA recombinase
MDLPAPGGPTINSVLTRDPASKRRFRHRMLPARRAIRPLSDRPLAYSYVRFSTPEQAKGDSYRRQVEKAEQYAAKHGMDLSLESFQDLGVSAWQGTNVATGQLGVFLDAVRRGDVAAGSTLLVESLDRISRSSALRALGVLQDIVEAGITVVTLTDERVYTAESLHGDPMSLLMSIMVFTRSNEESEIKSKRVREAWDKKKALARETGQPMTKVLPGWMRLAPDGSKVVLVEERAEVVRSIVRDTIAGVGLAKIASTLNARGVEPWGVGGKRAALWHKSYVGKIVRSPALIGTFTPRSSHKEGGKRVFVPLDPIEGYYPSAISRSDYERLEELLSGPRQPPMRASTGKVSNVLAGLAKCPLCGATMTRVNKGRKGGAPYLVCVVAKGGAGCEYRAIRLPHIEHALRLHGQELCVTAPDRDTGLDEEWLRLEHEIDSHDQAIGNLVEEIQAGNPSRALREQLVILEKDRAGLRDQQRGLATALSRSSGKTLERLLGGLEAALLNEASNATEINAALRLLVAGVRVDFTSGRLDFRWHHSERTTSIGFAWPREES